MILSWVQGPPKEVGAYWLLWEHETPRQQAIITLHEVHDYGNGDLWTNDREAEAVRDVLAYIKIPDAPKYSFDTTPEVST